MKILVTSSGRRNYLLKYFREANNLAPIEVYAADADSTAPSLAEADRAFVVPLIADPSYADVINKIVLEQNIDLVIPILDPDVIKLAVLRDDWDARGVTLVSASQEVSELCFDKLRAQDWLNSHGISTPATQTERTLSETSQGNQPTILKPRFGAGSLGIEYASHQSELTEKIPLLEKFIQQRGLISADDNGDILIQELVQGEDCSIEIANDLEGNYQGVCARKKLKVTTGETMKVQIIDPAPFRSIARQISALTRHRGSLDADVILTDSGPVVIELNPRFGGSYPFSHQAGFNLAPSLVAWKLGLTDHQLGESKVGTIWAKCDRVVQVGG